jgi:hypothetical protein
MGFKTKLLVGASTLAIGAGGMLGFASSSSATVTSVGSCIDAGAGHGRGVGTLKSLFNDPHTNKPAGLTTQDHDLKIGIKGVDDVTNKGTDMHVTCHFSGNSATPDDTTGVHTGTFTVSKWTASLVSPSQDCAQETPTPTNEWPNYGSIKYTFTDGSFFQASLATAGFVAGTGNETDSTGVVTKGRAAGAFIKSEIWFDPIVKDKTSNTPYFGYNYDVLNALACKNATAEQGPTDPGWGDITGILVGSGADPLTTAVPPTDPPAAGISFYLGQ